MVEADRGDVTPGKWESFLGVATVVLFGCLLMVTIVRLAVGWRSGSWQVGWQVVTGACTLSLLLYLGNGGYERILELNREDPAQKPSVAAMVGRVGMVLLTLSFVGNLASAIWEDSRPPALIVVRRVISGGFALCIIAYLALRGVQRYRARGAGRDQGAGRSD